MAKPVNQADLHALRNLISEAELLLSTIELPEGRAARALELLSAAVELADDLIAQTGANGAKKKILDGTPRIT
jgi:hypothetical protein